MTRADILERLDVLVQAFNAHDLDAVMACFSEDCELRMPRGPHPSGTPAHGRADVRRLLATRFEGLPDVHYGNAAHFADGDTGISKWTLTGTTPAGEKIEVNGCDFYTFRDGLVVANDSYWKIVG